MTYSLELLNVDEYGMPDNFITRWNLELDGATHEVVVQTTGTIAAGYLNEGRNLPAMMRRYLGELLRDSALDKGRVAARTTFDLTRADLDHLRF